MSEVWLTEQNISLYQDWLIRMTGLSCSKEQARKEIEFEISLGNNDDIKERINSVLLLKNQTKDPSITWQDILIHKINKGDTEMKVDNATEKTYESFAIAMKDALDEALRDGKLSGISSLSMDIQDRKWSTPGTSPISADHRALITAENENGQTITVDLMHVYCDLQKERIKEEDIPVRITDEINRAMKEHVKMQNELHGEEIER